MDDEAVSGEGEDGTPLAAMPEGSHLSSDELIAQTRHQRLSSAELIARAHDRLHSPEAPPPFEGARDLDLDIDEGADPFDLGGAVPTAAQPPAGWRPPGEQTAPRPTAPAPAPVPPALDRSEALRRARRIIQFVAAAIVFIIWLILANLGDGF